MSSSRSSVRHEVFAAAEFRSRQPDNLLRVENTGAGGVLIRSAKNNFDSAQRRTLIRYLKAEGFVPNHARLVVGDSAPKQVPGAGQILWVFEPSWPYAEIKFNHYTRMLCARLLLGPTLVWLLFMWFVAFR